MFCANCACEIKGMGLSLDRELSEISNSIPASKSRKIVNIIEDFIWNKKLSDEERVKAYDKEICVKCSLKVMNFYKEFVDFKSSTASTGYVGTTKSLMEKEHAAGPANILKLTSQASQTSHKIIIPGVKATKSPTKQLKPSDDGTRITLKSNQNSDVSTDVKLKSEPPTIESQKAPVLKKKTSKYKCLKCLKSFKPEEAFVNHFVNVCGKDLKDRYDLSKLKCLMCQTYFTVKKVKFLQHVHKCFNRKKLKSEKKEKERQVIAHNALSCVDVDIPDEDAMMMKLCLEKEDDFKLPVVLLDKMDDSKLIKYWGKKLKKRPASISIPSTLTRLLPPKKGILVTQRKRSTPERRKVTFKTPMPIREKPKAKGKSKKMNKEVKPKSKPKSKHNATTKTQSTLNSSQEQSRKRVKMDESNAVNKQPVQAFLIPTSITTKTKVSNKRPPALENMMDNLIASEITKSKPITTNDKKEPYVLITRLPNTNINANTVANKSNHHENIPSTKQFNLTPSATLNANPNQREKQFSSSSSSTSSSIEYSLSSFDKQKNSTTITTINQIPNTNASTVANKSNHHNTTPCTRQITSSPSTALNSNLKQREKLFSSSSSSTSSSIEYSLSSFDKQKNSTTTTTATALKPNVNISPKDHQTTISNSKSKHQQQEKEKEKEPTRTHQQSTILSTTPLIPTVNKAITNTSTSSSSEQQHVAKTRVQPATAVDNVPLSQQLKNKLPSSLIISAVNISSPNYTNNTTSQQLKQEQQRKTSTVSLDKSLGINVRTTNSAQISKPGLLQQSACTLKITSVNVNKIPQLVSTTTSTSLSSSSLSSLSSPVPVAGTQNLISKSSKFTTNTSLSSIDQESKKLKSSTSSSLPSSRPQEESVSAPASAKKPKEKPKEKETVDSPSTKKPKEKPKEKETVDSASAKKTEVKPKEKEASDSDADDFDYSMFDDLESVVGENSLTVLRRKNIIKCKCGESFMSKTFFDSHNCLS